MAAARHEKRKTILMGMTWVGVSALALAAVAGLMYFEKASKAAAAEKSQCTFEDEVEAPLVLEPI